MQEFNFVLGELRADPVLSKILDKPRVQKALQEVQQSKAAIARFKDDPEIMAVLDRLMVGAVQCISLVI